MWLRAFPAATGYSCCLGSGDWPLDPHEILLHPRDLEKLRVAAFGYVAVSSTTVVGDARTNTTSKRAERSPSSVHPDVKNGTKKKESEHVTFCRAVPDDSLVPGETRAPVWIMRAAGVRPRQHLAVERAPAPASTAIAETSAEEPPLDFRLEVSLVHSTFLHDNGDLGGDGDNHPTEGELQQSPRPNSNSIATTVKAVGLTENTCRAIARRLSACMVRAGSLLAAEVMDETVVLRVSAIFTDGNSDSGGGDGRGGLSSAEIRGVSGDVQDAATNMAVDVDDKGPDVRGHDHNDAPRLITSNTEIYVIIASNDVSSGTGISSDMRKVPSGQGQRRQPMNQASPVRERLSMRLGGEQEAWTRRAPGLEAVLRELHGLVLLSVGGLKQAVSGKRGDREGGRAGEKCEAGVLANRGAPADLPSVNRRYIPVAAPPPPPPPPPPQPQQPCVSDRDGGGAGGASGRDSAGSRSSGGNLLRWADVLPANIILCGPSGVGKTLALDVLSQDLRERHGVHVVRLLGPQILAGFSLGNRGHSSSGTSNLAGALAVALAEARSRSPAVLIVDELDVLFDAIGGDESVPLAEGSRASASLLAALDSASKIEGVTVMGATRRSPGGGAGAGWAGLEDGGGLGGDGAVLPAAFRKPGRFDRCVSIGPPTQAERAGILCVLLESRGWILEALVPPAPIKGVDVTEQGGTLERAARAGVDGKLKGQPRSPIDGQPSIDGKARERRGAVEDGGGRSTGDPGGNLSRGKRGVQREILVEWAKRISSVTPGMVAGDLERLVRTARARAAQRARSNQSASQTLTDPETMNTAGGVQLLPAQQLRQKHPLPLNMVTWRDAMGAVASTVPRSLRGMDVASSGASGGGPTWGSVGGFSEAKRRLQRLVQWPWLHPEAFARMGVSAPAGVLLCGPSGCGKSLVAQVLATECLANFVWVRSSELLSRYLGETEAKLRALFTRARAVAPCILFLDELDAITAKRGDGADAGDGAGGVHARVLSTLLNEMDGVATSAPRRSGPGVERGGGVLVLAATNRRDALDAALLRPGRLHESVEFGMPGREDREGVLRVHVRRLPLSAEVDIARLSQDDVSGGLSCADIEASCRDAAMMVVREDLHGAREVRPEHLRRALVERSAGKLKTRRFNFCIGQGPATDNA